MTKLRAMERRGGEFGECDVKRRHDEYDTPYIYNYTEKRRRIERRTGGEGRDKYRRFDIE